MPSTLPITKNSSPGIGSFLSFFEYRLDSHLVTQTIAIDITEITTDGTAAFGIFFKIFIQVTKNDPGPSVRGTYSLVRPNRTRTCDVIT